MANVEEIRALIQKRGTIKGQITTFKTFLDKYKQGEPDSLKLGLRLDKLKSVFENFDDTQDQLELLDTDNDHTDERYVIQEQYFEVLTDAERLLKIARKAEEQAEGTNRDHTPVGAQVDPVQRFRRIKLPEASLPTFDGRYEDWLSFKDAFTSMIHNQPDLNNIEKLQYLKSTLKGEALGKIQVFSITDENYAHAWELLQETYSDKRILISRHLSLLLRLPVQEKETAEGLTKLLDRTQQHLLSLKSLGVNLPDEIVVQNIEEKLHKTTGDKWDETLERNVFPTFDKMTEFLRRTAARLSRKEGPRATGSGSSSHGQQTKANSQSSSGKGMPKSKRQAFVTSTAATCPVCKDKAHPIYRCETFRNLPVAQRFKTVKDAALCWTCLRPNHEQKDCKSGNCMACNQRHNTLLHQSKDQANTANQS